MFDGVYISIDRIEIAGVYVSVEIQAFVVITAFYAQLEINVFFFADVSPPGVAQPGRIRFDEAASFVAGYNVQPESVVVVSFEVGRKE